jgi:hypothetical protein
MRPRFGSRVDRRAAVLAGIAGGLAYVATMEIDNRLLERDVDDLELLGRPFTAGPKGAKLIGTPIHLVNSVLLAITYAVVGRDRLPGPAWLRGVIFANIENTALYPIAAFESLHPGIRNGEIERYFSLASYLQSIPRHISYGAVTAILYERLRKK